jgi:DHA3 family macrolide efflux protein-like MFS transporter
MYRSEDWQVPFFTIWIGQAFSLVGSRVAQFALVWWITDTTGSATALATASLVAVIPEIALGPIAGAYVDRLSRRTVMILADSLVALASLWLALMFWMGSIEIWHIYVLMVVRSIGGSFHWPAMQASTSLMVPKAQLTRVAGLNQTLYGVLNIIGPPLGAALMAFIPLHSVMLVDVGTAALAIVPLFFVFIPQPQRAPPSEWDERKTSIWDDIRAGLDYIWGWPGIVALIIMAMAVKFALAPASALLPLLVRSRFNGDASQLGLLEAIVGIGIVVGGVLLSVWGGFRRKIYTILMGFIVFSLSFVSLGLTPSDRFLIALGSSFVIGFVIPMIDGPFLAIFQSTVAPDIQGRVFTLVGSLLSLTSPLGLVIAGPISDWLGLQIFYLAAGALCGVMGVVGFFVPAIVNIEENANATRKAESETAGADVLAN